MSLRVLLLIALALCVSLCVAVPKHHSFEEDLEVLEKGLDEIADAEEEEDEDADTQDSKVGDDAEVEARVPALAPLLLALDCGSSGSKMMLFAKTKGDCPNPTPINPGGRTVQNCADGIKFTPTMTDLNHAEWMRQWAQESSGTTRLERATLIHYRGNLQEFAAFATAGNRIIPAGTNTTAWNALKAAVATRYSSLNLEASGTIPGTQEAWLEFRGANGDFVSMGGASAQFGVALDTVGKLQKWSLAMKRAHSGGSLEVTMCNNQNEESHFFMALSNHNDYESGVNRGEFKTKCHTGNCVGLASWLAIKEIAGQTHCATGYGGDASNPGLVNHWAGGIDQSIEGFETVMKARGKEGDCWGSSADSKKCAAHMVQFSRYDRTTETIRRFVQGVYDSNETFHFRILAALSKAVSFYNSWGNQQTMTCMLQAGGKGSGKARFAMWGVSGILVAPWIIPPDSGSFLAFTAAKALPTNGASWIGQVAANQGYPALCPMILLQEGNAVDPKALDSCMVDLTRTERN